MDRLTELQRETLLLALDGFIQNAKVKYAQVQYNGRYVSPSHLNVAIALRSDLQVMPVAR